MAEPRQATIQEALAHIKTWITAGEKEKAKQGLQEVLEFEPGNAEAKKMLEELGKSVAAPTAPAAISAAPAKTSVPPPTSVSPPTPKPAPMPPPATPVKLPIAPPPPAPIVKPVPPTTPPPQQKPATPVAPSAVKPPTPTSTKPPPLQPAPSVKPAVVAPSQEWTKIASAAMTPKLTTPPSTVSEKPTIPHSAVPKPATSASNTGASSTSAKLSFLQNPKIKGIVFLAGAVIVLVIGGYFVYTMLSSNTPAETTNTSEVINTETPEQVEKVKRR